MGWATIPAVVKGVSGTEAELAEIDENLIRNDLNALEQGEHLLRRNEILEEMELRARPSPGTNQYRVVGEDSSPTKTTSEIAAEVGLSERVAQQRVQVARNLVPEVKEAIRDTDLADRKTA